MLAASLEDRRLAYEVRGDGPPLVPPAWWVSHLELDWRRPGVRRICEGIAENYTRIRFGRLPREPVGAETTFSPLQGNSQLRGTVTSSCSVAKG